MAEKAGYRLTIYDRRDDGGHYTLDAQINENGDLVLEGYDIGRFVQEWWGDSDYEFWRVVKAPQVPWVLLHLVKDRFEKESDFAAWLKEKGIPSEFSSWV